MPGVRIEGLLLAGEDRVVVASFMTGVVGGTLDLDVTLSAPGDENRTPLVVWTHFSSVDTLADKSWRREYTLLMTR